MTSSVISFAYFTHFSNWNIYRTNMHNHANSTQLINWGHSTFKCASSRKGLHSATRKFCQGHGLWLKKYSPTWCWTHHHSRLNKITWCQACLHRLKAFITLKNKQSESRLPRCMWRKWVLLCAAWLNIGQFFFCMFMDRDGVEVHKLAKTIPSHLDQKSFVNKGFIIWLSGKFFSKDTVGRAR